MSGPYRTPLPTVAEMVDELVAAGRTIDAACIELRNMIRDGVVTLLDFHHPPQTQEWVAQGAILVIDAFRQRKPATFGALPWGYPEYFRDGVVAVRAQFETAAGLQLSEKEPPPSNRRFTSDEKLVTEAIDGLRSDKWPNVHQAALALQSQADGASAEAKVRRLSEKIRKAMT